MTTYDTHLCLAEAAQKQAAVWIRALFITLLVGFEPPEPVKLYDNYKPPLPHDFNFQRRKQGLP